MEPAAERREYFDVQPIELGIIPPQWSPPLNGGSTWAMAG